MLNELTFKRAGTLNLCLRDIGVGPAVIFLHGTSANLGVWDAVVKSLAGGVRTVAIDQRGHGRSDKPKSGYGAAEYSTDIAHLIRELDCGPVVAVGHSLGARNSVVLAARYPDLVSSVVAVDYTPFVEKEVLDDLQERVAVGDQIFSNLDEVRKYLRQRYSLIQDDAVERRALYGYAYDDNVDGYRPLATPEALKETVDGLRVDFVDATRAVRAPVTLIRGTLSRIVSDETMRKTRVLRPDFRVLELPEVDHYVPEEKPEVIATEIYRMLSYADPASQISNSAEPR